MLPIKAIPTRYAGVNFRSRLEARWAAFFDLNGFNWEYEPCDFDGWCPDFKLDTPIGPVFAEVKPYDWLMIGNDSTPYRKAMRHFRKVKVLLLGNGPWRPYNKIGFFMMELSDSEKLLPVDDDDLWREAGNRVQWKPPQTDS